MISFGIQKIGKNINNTSAYYIWFGKFGWSFIISSIYFITTS